jgi:chromosome segregation ATPase
MRRSRAFRGIAPLAEAWPLEEREENTMSNGKEGTLRHINLLTQELQTLQKRRSELVDSGLNGKQPHDGWKSRVESLDAQISDLQTKINRGHTDLGSKP